MATTFTREDAQTCFRCDINPPSFRLISLERVPSDDGLIPECMVTLLCQDCLRFELDDFHEALNQTSIPFGEDATEESFLCRQIGVLVVPLAVSYNESRLLVEELQTDGLECVVN
jgi:hypothetical protein